MRLLGWVGLAGAFLVATLLGVGSGRAAPSRQASSSAACGSVLVATADGTYAYDGVTARGIDCAGARTVVRAAAAWPPPRGWTCTVGDRSKPWGLSCRNGAKAVDARGPRLVTATRPSAPPDPWKDEATALGAFLYRPTVTAGLQLTSLTLMAPCSVAFTVLADYGEASGPNFTVAEGKPSTCGSLGDPPRLATWRVHGHPAELVEDCAPTGCSRTTGDYALQWYEGGLDLVLFTQGFGQRELLALARSMTRVP